LKKVTGSPDKELVGPGSGLFSGKVDKLSKK
jgi:hypothetical protein